MNLFELKDSRVVFSPEALLLTPFKELWSRDKTKTKDIAVKELAYIFFMGDYKSDYIAILNEGERRAQVIKDIELPKSWKPDGKVILALKFYEEMRDGLVMKLYKAAKTLLTKITEFANNVNLEERDKSNKPVFNINQLNSVVKELSSSAESVSKLERMVKEEISNNKDRLGSRTKALFEDDI